MCREFVMSIVSVLVNIGSTLVTCCCPTRFIPKLEKLMAENLTNSALVHARTQVSSTSILRFARSDTTIAAEYLRRLAYAYAESPVQILEPVLKRNGTKTAHERSGGCIVDTGCAGCVCDLPRQPHLASSARRNHKPSQQRQKKTLQDWVCCVRTSTPPAHNPHYRDSRRWQPSQAYHVSSVTRSLPTSFNLTRIRAQRSTKRSNN
jgi:hypothetical protein